MLPNFLQTAFLAGSIAIAVPILIHLFFRLKTKHVQLGTIRFLRAVLEENARRRKVMRWLLLALRMGFVALLVGLFARPYLTAKTISGEKDLLVILIDQSATMQLKGDRVRLIDHALADARRLIESAGSGTRFEIAFFDQAVHPITTTQKKEELAVDSILERLQAPSGLYGATNYGTAIAWARDICVKASTGRKQLHLFTDLQRSGLDWTEVEPLPAEVQAHLHDLGNSVVNNVAVSEIRTPRLWVRPGSSPTVQASIVHGGAFSLTEVPVVLEIGRIESPAKGKSIRTPFSGLAERITKRERVKLEPGATVMLDFELPSLTEGLWQGRITVEYDDDLGFDNQRYFAISATPAYNVLILNGGEVGTNTMGESYFLETALRLAPEGELFDESPFAPKVFPYPAGTALPDISRFDAIVLVDVAGIGEADARQLAKFVSAGGGLLVFTGDNVNAQSCAALNAAGLGIGTIGEPKVTVDLPWRLSKWDATHPVLQPLSDPQHGDLRRLIFAAYTHVTPSPEATVLMSFGTGDPAILERKFGEGTALWVTSSCGRDWSDWSRSRLFLPLVHQLLGYEVGMTEGGRVRTQLVDVDTKLAAPPGAPRQQDVNPARADQKTETNEIETPGVIQFDRYADVVNTSPRESDTERCTRQEFEDRFAVKFVDSDGSTSKSAEIGAAEFHQDEIWHWAACAMLAVILLEGFVGNRTTA